MSAALVNQIMTRAWESLDEDAALTLARSSLPVLEQFGEPIGSKSVLVIRRVPAWSEFDAEQRADIVRAWMTWSALGRELQLRFEQACEAEWLDQRIQEPLKS